MSIVSISKSGNFICANTILKNHVDLDVRDKVFNSEYYCFPGTHEPAFFQGYEHGLFVGLEDAVGMEVISLNLALL
jgi:hypothetical protein